MGEVFNPQAESQKVLDPVSLNNRADPGSQGRMLDEICNLTPGQRQDMLGIVREQAGWQSNRNCLQSDQASANSQTPRINVILVDTVAFPGHAEADRESNLYDEVLEFHHGRDLPAMMKMLKDKYPDARFDITTDTHGNSGSPKGYKLLQKKSGPEYVKYGELEEALAGAKIDENSVRIFYGGCNAATGYFNAKLSDTAKRYEKSTYGAASMNMRDDDEPIIDFLRPYENDPRYGLLSEIKKPLPDQIDAHSHSVPLEQKEYKVKLEEIARLRKTHPDVFEARIREFAQSYRQPAKYYRDLSKPS